MAKGPTVDQLRAEIDSGRTGEKIAFPDPAAAPLGTDAEAGGNPPRPAEVAQDLAASKRQRVHVTRDIGAGLYLCAVGVTSIAILIIIAVAK